MWAADRGLACSPAGEGLGVAVPPGTLAAVAGMRPIFCRVKLRMAGLGLWVRCMWAGKGEIDGAA